MASHLLSESFVCRSLSPSVTPQSAAATHSPLMHFSILAIMVQPLPPTLITSKGEHVNILSSHSAKKAPPPLRDLHSASADRSAEPSPSSIYLSIRLPVFMPRHLSAVFTSCLYIYSSLRMSQFFLLPINLLCCLRILIINTSGFKVSYTSCTSLHLSIQ